MSEFDWNDSKKLSALADDLIITANEYRATRNNFTKNKLALDMLLIKEYFEGNIDQKHAYEKALLLVLDRYRNGNMEEEVFGYYEMMKKYESDYKGLERVLDAKQSKISLCQSLIKNQIRNT